MKKAKTYKFLLLTAALLISFALSLTALNFGAAKAAEMNPSDYFAFNGSSSSTFSLDGENVLMNVKSGDSLKFKNKIVISGMTIKLILPEEAVKFSVEITADSYGVNGNFNEETEEYDTGIVNLLTIEKSEGSSYSAKFNGENAGVDFISADGAVEIAFGISDGVVTPVINESASSITGDGYRRVKTSGSGISVGSVKLIADEISGEDTAEVKLVSVSQYSATDAEKYVQTFKTNEDKTRFEARAYPVITLNDSLFVKGKATAKLATETSLTVTGYALLGGYASSDFTLQDSTSDILTKAKKVWFMNEGENVLGITFRNSDGEDVTVPFNFNVVDEPSSGDGANAPVYVAGKTTDAYKAFTAALENALYSDKENGVFVSIGSDEYLELPSMKDLVEDDSCSYEDMTHTVYYKTPTGQSSSSNLKIPLENPGKYEFYVVFKDKAGNAMESDSFYTVEDEVKSFGEYGDFVFSFEMDDNYPMEITPAESQGKGYVGTKYTASDFEIKASSYKVSYTLYYKADAENDSWTLIPVATEVAESDYEEKGGIKYSDVTEINYDGKLTFTPTKIGYYRIECEVRSTSSVRSEKAVSQTISVTSRPKTVVVDNHWLENNVWSVVFLSIGTLCLVGIVVLLFIKPKDEKAE